MPTSLCALWHAVSSHCGFVSGSKGREYFTPLQQGDASYNALDAVRRKRNALMHAKEKEVGIDSQKLVSLEFVDVDENSCREYLKQLRLGVAFVFDQLKNCSPPINTKENVRWLGELEVP